MANPVNPISTSVRLADFLATAISDGTYSNVLSTLKTDTPATPASRIFSHGGQLWSNLQDDMFLLNYQALYRGAKWWQVDDDVARDALGSDDGLAVNDLLWQLSDSTLWYCDAVTGTDSSTWTSIGAGGASSLQAAYGIGNTITTDVSDGDVTIDGTEALVIGTEDLLADVTTFSIDGGSASNVSVTSGNLTVSTITSGALIATSAGLFDLNAGANLDVDVTGTLDVLSTGAFSVDGTGASNVSATSGNLTVSTITSGTLLLTSAGAVNVNAGAFSTAFSNSSGAWQFPANCTAGTATTIASVPTNFGVTPTRVVQAGSTTALDVVGHQLSIAEGSRNTRVSFFLQDGAAGSGAWGHWLAFGSGGYQPYVIGMATSQLFQLAQPGGTSSFLRGSPGSSASSAGLALTLEGGTGGATSGAGGAVTLQGGAATTEGAGGAVVIAGRNGVTGSATARAGGSVTLTGGNATVDASGGSISATAGTSVSGDGGSSSITAGNSTSGAGGNVILTAGTGGGGNGFVRFFGDLDARNNAAFFSLNPTITGGTTGGGTFTVTGSAGTAAGTAVILRGVAAGSSGTGGAVSITAAAGGSSNGAGGALALTAGSATTSGSGGAVSIAAGAGVGTNQAGGGITVTGGNSTGSAGGGPATVQAGASLGTAMGGQANLIGGAGGTTSGTGGPVLVRAGHATGTGQGGAVSVQAGNAAGNNHGGAVTITAGNGLTSGNGGAVNITGGTPGVTGIGGAVIIASGPGGATSAGSGALTLQTGTPVDGVGGAIAITASAGVGTNRAGGAVTITAGDGSNTTGVGGTVTIFAGTGASNAVSGDIVLIPGVGTGAANSAGMVDVRGSMVYGSSISPAALASGNTDNYAPTGGDYAGFLRLTANAANSVLRGLAGGQAGRRVVISNIATTGTITLLHDDGASSTAANRFLCPGSVSLVIPVNGTRELIYDGTSSRWRVIGAVA